MKVNRKTFVKTCAGAAAYASLGPWPRIWAAGETPQPCSC